MSKHARVPRRCIRSLRRAAAVVTVAVVLATAGGLVDAGADDPVASPSTVVGQPGDTTGQPTPPGDSPQATSTPPGNVTTTTGPGTPPVTAGPGGFGGPPVDPNAPPEPPMPDPSPEVRILLDQLLDQRHGQLVDQQAAVARMGDAGVARQLRIEQAARDTLGRSRLDLRRADARIARAERDLRADALARYMDPGATGFEAIVDTAADTSTRTRGVLVDVTTGLHRAERRNALAHRAAVRRRIARNETTLERARNATERARVRARNAENSARLLTLQAEAQQHLLDSVGLDSVGLDSVGRRGDAVVPVARAGEAESSPDGWSLPIAGQSVFDASELAEWFVQRGLPSRARAPIADLARYYIEEGTDQGIRGDMAFAQSVLETGSFTNPDTVRLNNFAGIGHCDTCAQGFAFATPQLGVRAQIQLLADYTQRGVVLAHPLVDRRLHGPSGCCQTWWQLTHTWASAGNYGPKIMGIYREMLYWLVIHRGMVPLVGPS